MTPEQQTELDEIHKNHQGAPYVFTKKQVLLLLDHIIEVESIRDRLAASVDHLIAEKAQRASDIAALVACLDELFLSGPVCGQFDIEQEAPGLQEALERVKGWSK